jgi:geranylgeranyl diphosphate synthase, type II
MKKLTRIEWVLAQAVAAGEAEGCPPRLAGAIRHAVFPGGARIRPQLCLAVAQACGDADPLLAEGAACAIELLHCASLVHDDLPCFDDAATRRGRASVHYAYGEPLAVLAGDALIVLAFQTIAQAAAQSPQRLSPMLTIVARGAGMPFGIVAGQAWECEPKVSLAVYQQAKTGALFSASTMAGALAGGGDPSVWREFGERLGEAYQAADDIRDVVGDPRVIGKPTGRDQALSRPSMAAELGLDGAVAHFEQMMGHVLGAIPPCAGEVPLRALVRLEAARLVPSSSIPEPVTA